MMKITYKKRGPEKPENIELIKNVLELSGIKELNPVQKMAIEHGLLSEKNMVISSPTASGKTLMAEMAALKTIKQERKKAIYMAPLIALASEKYDSFKKKYEPLGIRVALSVGDFDSADPWLRDYDLIVCSNEKMDSLLRHGIDWAKDIGMVIADEVHLLNDQSRGPTLEIVLTKLLEIANSRFIALSATIKNAWELAEWLKAEHVFSEWRPVELKEGVAYENEINFETCKEALSVEQTEISIAKSTLKKGKQALFFVATRKFTESLAKQLNQEMGELLKEDEKKELVKLSEEVLGVLEKPTEQCIKLSQCIKNGVAFHHAGLVGRQKSLIEEYFRKGKIKFIVATPTLAMGVSLPAFRVIIRDSKRYYPRLGSVYIPVMEYKQMAGRAGRPEWDDHGESILVAKNAKEAKEFWDHYINGETEEIYSKLAVEPVLRTHALALISSGLCKSEKDLFEFFSKTFYAHQYGDERALNKKLREVLAKLDNWKMISGFIHEQKMSSLFQTANEMVKEANSELKPTAIGKRVSELYIDPQTAWQIMVHLKMEADVSEITFFHMISQTLEMAPALNVRSSEYDDITEELEKNKEHLLGKIPSEWDEEFEEFVRSFKTSLMMKAWSSESNEEEIMLRFGVAPGELRARLDIADWILYSSSELAYISKNDIMLRDLKKARTRLKYGVKEELLPLVKLKGIGRARARKLYNAGIKSALAIKNAHPEKLKELIGEKLSKNLKENIENY